MTNSPIVDLSVQDQDDDTRQVVLDALTGGRPHALISMYVTPEGRMLVNVDCGGGITNATDLEEFLAAALRYLRER